MTADQATPDSKARLPGQGEAQLLYKIGIPLEWIQIKENDQLAITMLNTIPAVDAEDFSGENRKKAKTKQIPGPEKFRGNLPPPEAIKAHSRPGNVKYGEILRHGVELFRNTTMSGQEFLQELNHSVLFRDIPSKRNPFRKQPHKNLRPAAG